MSNNILQIIPSEIKHYPFDVFYCFLGGGFKSFYRIYKAKTFFYPNYYLFINRIPNYYLFINGIPIHRISLTATSVFFHRILYTCTCNRISSLKTTMTT